LDFVLGIFSLPGPPLTEMSAIEHLLQHNVTVGIGIQEIWSARNARFDVAWASAIAPVLSSRKEYVLILHTGSNRSWWQNFQRAGVCFGVYEYRESTRASEHPGDVRFGGHRGWRPS